MGTGGTLKKGGNTRVVYAPPSEPQGRKARKGGEPLWRLLMEEGGAALGAAGGRRA